MAGIPTRKTLKPASLEDAIAGAKASAAEETPGPETVKRGVGKPRAVDADLWTRQTFIIRRDYLEKLQALAYWDRRTTKVVLDMALEQFFEGKNIKPVPHER